MYLCICQAVTVAEVREVVEAGVRDFDALADRFSLGGEDNCGACLAVLEDLINETPPARMEASQHVCEATRPRPRSAQRLACAGTSTPGGIE